MSNAVPVGESGRTPQPSIIDRLSGRCAAIVENLGEKAYLYAKAGRERDVATERARRQADLAKRDLLSKHRD